MSRNGFQIWMQSKVTYALESRDLTMYDSSYFIILLFQFTWEEQIIFQYYFIISCLITYESCFVVLFINIFFIYVYLEIFPVDFLLFWKMFLAQIQYKSAFLILIFYMAVIVKAHLDGGLRVCADRSALE